MATTEVNGKICLNPAYDVSKKDIGFNADDNEVSIFYKNKSSEKISKTNKSLIANEIVKRVTQEFN